MLANLPVVKNHCKYYELWYLYKYAIVNGNSDGYLASNGEYTSLMSDAVDSLESPQAHGMIDVFVFGSVRVQCVCADHWL